MAISPSDGARKAAADLAGKKIKGTDRDLVRSDRSARLPDGRAVHRFVTASRKDPNGPAHSVVLGDDGKEVDAASLPSDIADALGVTRVRPAAPGSAMLASKAASASIDPRSNDLVLELGDTETEIVTVTIPPRAGVSKADVYLLADNTGSMGPVLDAVKAGASDILNAITSLDIAFGVGNYRDYPDTAPPFTHQLAPDTNAANVAAAINAWTADGGGDGSEGQLYALYQLGEAPGGPIGWRPDAKRIIVWFGDAPGHDPICRSFTGLPFDITENVDAADKRSATSRLVNQDISVIAISTRSEFFANALDDDPSISDGNYTDAGCSTTGNADQATRIAAATGGIHVSNIDADEIVGTIIELIEAAIGKIDKLTLEPSASVAPFVVSISPPQYINLPGDEQHVLPFKVTWRGIKP
ncbi:MAG: hypothetical protein AAF543_23000, partial [Pseudomonadota bacterium]